MTLVSIEDAIFEARQRLKMVQEVYNDAFDNNVSDVEMVKITTQIDKARQHLSDLETQEQQGTKWFPLF